MSGLGVKPLTHVAIFMAELHAVRVRFHTWVCMCDDAPLCVCCILVDGSFCHVVHILLLSLKLLYLHQFVNINLYLCDLKSVT